MAIEFMDGFDQYGGQTEMTALGMYTVANGAVSTTAPKTGSRCYALGGSFSTIIRSFAANRTYIGAHQWARLDSVASVGGATGINILDSAGTTQIGVAYNSDGTLSVKTGAGATLGTTAVLIVSNNWHHVVLEINGCSTTTGAVKLWVDDVLVLNLTNVNTNSAGTGNFRKWYAQGNSSIILSIDDLYVWNNTGSNNTSYPGVVRIRTLFPNGDTAQADWAPNTGGTGYTQIDEVGPNSDTDYVEAASVGNISDYNLENLPGGVVGVLGVQTYVNQKKSDTGSAATKVSLNSGGSIGAGTANNLTTGYGYYTDIFETDPATSSAWAPSAIDALKVRIERTA